jgi:hypothetical protein
MSPWNNLLHMYTCTLFWSFVLPTVFVGYKRLRLLLLPLRLRHLLAACLLNGNPGRGGGGVRNTEPGRPALMAPGQLSGYQRADV